MVIRKSLDNLTFSADFLFQSVLRKMTPEDAPKISDQVMTALLSMFQNTSGKAGSVQEDALLAVSTLVEGLFNSL